MTSILRNSLIIVTAYFLAFFATVVLIVPLQDTYLPGLSTFASLVYLPHGVRILATWLWGWRAVLPIALGDFATYRVFRSAFEQRILDPVVMESLAIGALCALLAFGLLRLFGLRVQGARIGAANWRILLLVGLVASLINSTVQAMIYSGLVMPEDMATVFTAYAFGDLAGLVVCMLVLMLAFRWARLTADGRAHR